MHIMKRETLIFIAILLCYNVYTQEIFQWRGENRDGIYSETDLLKEWPDKGPAMLWHYDSLGRGHSSAAISKSMVYTAGTFNGLGYLFAFDYNGVLKWKKEYGEEWVESWEGVRTTPLIYDGKLYLMSGYGKVVCFNAKSGDIDWSVDLLKVYDGRNLKWGMTENLLIDGHKLFCVPGGVDANVIALDRNTGKLIWKSKGNGEKSAYCSPMIIKLEKQQIFVTMTEKSILGIDASDGKLLWKHDQPNKYFVHANTPIYHNGYLYCVSGYGKGGVMLKLSENGESVTEVWRNSSLDNRMGGVVLVDGRLYGSADKTREWKCLDWKTGKELFTNDMMSKGNTIYSDGMLYCYGEDGTVGLVKIEESKFNLISSFDVTYGLKQHWAHLVIHNKKLYVRHGGSLMVYSISKK